MQLIIHFPLLFLQWGFFVSLHPSADTLAVFNSARYIPYTPIADYHSDTNIHHTHETLALSTSPGVVYISVVCIYRRVCTRRSLPGKGCGGTEFLGTRKKLFCVKGAWLVFIPAPSFSLYEIFIYYPNGSFSSRWYGYQFSSIQNT